ncbi:MAG: holo-ACP synthase [Dehalococcoidia bacterium]|nr:holo-ACP synthase [Dehalococcoidia bacterium]
MHSVGVDVIEIDRVRKVLTRHGLRFLTRVYTEPERMYCRNRISELAVRFAGKEAVMKALGTGIRGVGWREIEILPDRRGKPHVVLYDRAKDRAEDLGLTEFAISLSHAHAYAVAFVVASNHGDGISP